MGGLSSLSIGACLWNAFFLCGVNDICNGVQMCDQFSIFIYEIVKCENFIIEISFVNCFLSFVQNNSIFC